jgi:hypothetical protein
MVILMIRVRFKDAVLMQTTGMRNCGVFQGSEKTIIPLENPVNWSWKKFRGRVRSLASVPIKVLQWDMVDDS